MKLLITIPGIGLFSAVLIYSEIGDIRRFPDSSKLLVYTGTIPSVRQSADVFHYGHITYQGSKYLRWNITEALHVHMRFDPRSSVSRFYKRISKGKKISKALVAAANKLVKIVYWVLKEKRPYYRNETQ